MVSESDIKKLVCLIENYLKENNCFHILQKPPGIYNGEETCFMSCSKAERIFTETLKCVWGGAGSKSKFGGDV